MTKEQSEYAQIHEIMLLLKDAPVPVDNRVMYYFVISWWRHPIKRYKQLKNMRSILETTDA